MSDPREMRSQADSHDRTTTADTIVAVTSEDGGHAGVVSRAGELARAADAALILFDLDSSTGPLESPLPTEWSGEGEQEQFGRRLTPSDLEVAGRAAIARQVRELRDQGVNAFGWLPETVDGSSLAAYAAQQRAGLVLVSTEDEQLIEELRSAAGDETDTDESTGPSRVRVEAVPPA